LPVKGVSNEIHGVSYLNETLLLVSFVKDTKMVVLNYINGEVNFEFESPAKDKSQRAIVSL